MTFKAKNEFLTLLFYYASLTRDGGPRTRFDSFGAGSARRVTTGITVTLFRGDQEQRPPPSPFCRPPSISLLAIL